MDYRNSQTKLETLVQYFNEERMNLIPIFQRPKVWPLRMRQELVKNIVNGRPIPAIFMYKDVSGSAFKFNILDGKQRLDSIAMFLAVDPGSKHFGVQNWRDYILDKQYRKEASFRVDFGDGKKKHLEDLDENTIARLREYLVPTIEIELNENTSLNELINLFVDINQYGVRVNRVNIIRAMKQNDPLLKDVYALIAERQIRKQDVFTKRKGTPFVFVLKRLNIISGIANKTVQADRMWEKLLELALFVRSNGNHRKPTEILKSFIKKPDVPARLSSTERSRLTRAFTFLKSAYKNSPFLETSRLATDQTHFYTMATALLNSDILSRIDELTLIQRIARFASLLEKPPDPQKGPQDELEKSVAKYVSLSSEKTTDATRRKERQMEFVKAIDLM
ncbi:MAG: DUF262 domain-containing protein [Terracidiphilus sp.]